MYDAVVIGGGVIGCAIARELSRWQLNLCVLEKNEDVCTGTSKANSAIVHAGFDAAPGTLKAKFNVLGSQMMEELSSKLDFSYRGCGALVICFTDGLSKLNELYQRGLANGVKELRIIEWDELHTMEPGVSSEAIAALYAPTSGIVCPFGLTIALAENAFANGAEFRFNTQVEKLSRQNGGYWLTTACGETIETRAVINAAGVYGDILHNQICRDPVTIMPRKGEYCILDRKDSGIVKRTVFQMPGNLGKGILVTPTVHGNILIGPTAADQDDKEGTDTTAEGLANAMEKAKFVPDLPLKDTITSFAGLRAHISGGDDDFILGEKVPGYFEAIGIESPGLSASPAIGVYIAKQVADYLRSVKKENFIDKRKGIIHLRQLPLEEQQRLIRKNPAYGAIVCRCEQISEGEILDAIRRPLGARSLDGVKRRVRAGMGRCQSGFCSPRVMQLLSEELHQPMTKLTKSGGTSWLIAGSTKEAFK